MAQRLRADLFPTGAAFRAAEVLLNWERILELCWVSMLGVGDATSVLHNDLSPASRQAMGAGAAGSCVCRGVGVCSCSGNGKGCWWQLLLLPTMAAAPVGIRDGLKCLQLDSKRGTYP